MHRLLASLFLFSSMAFAASQDLPLRKPWSGGLAPGAEVNLTLPLMDPGITYALNIALMTGGLAEDEVVQARLDLGGGRSVAKALHGGDPGLYVPFRGATEAHVFFGRGSGSGQQEIQVQAQWEFLADPEQAHLFEAEPNDAPAQANPLRIGNTVEGSVDDVEYLDNQQEGKSGLDWFRFTIDEQCLVIFELDVPDRDVSVNMRVYTDDPAAPGAVKPYLEGKDPMEIVHDREPERYSKSVTRVFAPGEYLLEVNANHPRYQVRSFKYPVPPYTDPRLAVEVGLRYIMDVGDAWFAQIPREGNIYRRAQNMHETAMRCTACHPAIFSTEPNLVAHRNGYAIPSKQNFRYVVERIYNSNAPFYGPDELYWQRFIAIPLQSQGKQGGVLMDYEAQISGQETDIVNRFGPLLRMAWLTREVLPEDEANGVLPADSAFGFAWRDWRVMEEIYRRTGDESYRQATDNIERIFISDASAQMIDNLQDRMHLVFGLNLMGRDYYRGRIQQEIATLFSSQNEDGGWHEEGKVGSPSAVYTTGQMLYTLMEAGLRPESEPRIDKGLQWLLTQQQSFGGWFQTTTHENFRTPMRESRYALIALAEGYPKGAPLRGLGNVDGGPASPPPVDAPAAEVIPRLENILEAPGAERQAVAASVIPLLQRPEVPVRAAAAELLGRIGAEESVEPLLALFRDPAKAVWRDAAWALRQLGNRGLAVDRIKTALRDPDPLVRRSASRVFAYQFQGMDRDREIPALFEGLIDDPDLLVRLQAIRTLRQWWYRDDDPELRLAIVNTFIKRMGVPDLAVVRTNLAQNMYILLDENQTGGVSMQRNIRDFPPDRAEAVLAGRRRVEENILLKPVLTAMADGNELQRAALLESFDGAFFKGRYYARVPRNMIDVGNDREFSFMYVPDISLLESTVGKIVKEEPRSAQRSRGIQLASFFELPGQSSDLDLKLALLDTMNAEDATLRGVARESVQKDLVIQSAESMEMLAPLTRSMHGQDREVRRAVLAALARSPQAMNHPTLRQTVAELAEESLAFDDANADLLPFLKTDLLDDTQASSLLKPAWNALRDKPAAEKLPLVEAVFQRAWQPKVKMGPAVLDALQRAATDTDVAVREKVFELLPADEPLRKSAEAAPLLYAGLSDDSPAIRAKALGLARENEAVWREQDVHEYVLKLLIDADAAIRVAALQTVAERGLLAQQPRYAPRIKAVYDGDEALRPQADAVLRAAALDPAAVVPDARIAEVRHPDVWFFREQVNDYLYRLGADQHACADCHATHTILGLAETPKDRPLTDEEIVNNYRSILKVVNTADPEASLILRKPRSPFGTGNASADSPTGITHVGGVRWSDDTANEAYQAILAFVRTAQDAQETVPLQFSADSFTPDQPPAAAGDGNIATIWHTEYVGATPGYPHELVIALDAAAQLGGMTYYPSQTDERGRVKEFEVYTSEDGVTWGEPLKHGVYDNDALPKTVLFPARSAKYLKLRGLSEVKNQPFMSAAEVEPILARTRGGKQVQAKAE